MSFLEKKKKKGKVTTLLVYITAGNFELFVKMLIFFSG
jgi:hypothetical protein